MAKKAQSQLSVFGYTDYRQYLRDFYQFKKDSYRGYSFRQFSKDAGFTSPNILKLVTDGERNLTATSLEQFVKGLRLEGAMAEYFRALVLMNQADNDADKAKHYAELKRLAPSAKKRDLDADSVAYLSHWLFPVLREMSQIDGFVDDPYWIARRLTGRANVKQITHAMKFLIEKGFIERKDDGRYASRDNMVLSSDEVRSLAIRQYHRTMLEQAGECLEDIPMEEREFGALTFMVPAHKLEELKFKMKEFRRSIHLWAMQAAEEKAADAVVQVNMQMYPQTKRNNG